MKNSFNVIKQFLLFLPLFLIMGACTYTPEERAEKCVNDYCKAVQNNNWDKMYSLTYDKEIVEVVEEVVEVASDDTSTPLKSNLTFDVKKQCVITDKRTFEVTSVRNIYSSPEVEDTDAVAVEAVESTELTPGGNSTISWPSDVQAAFEVNVSSGDTKVGFTVVRLGENDYKIYSTKGLYIYELEDVTTKTGCSITLPRDVDDERMERNVYLLIDNLKMFDILSNAVANNDSAKIMRLFPALARHNYQFKAKPLPRAYKQIDNGAVILTNDSMAFKISSDGVIVDSYGVISSKRAEDAVNALGGTPHGRDMRFDIEYIGILGDQVLSLQREKERKARAAKYKTQGVALISSRLSSNGKGAKGVNFSALNTSNKKAKYIIMEVVGYNSVSDPVWSNGYLKRCRGIGPIDPGEGGSWNFDDIWENGDIVDDYEIKALIIQFADGTSKSVKLPQSLPSDWRNWLY